MSPLNVVRKFMRPCHGMIGMLSWPKFMPLQERTNPVLLLQYTNHSHGSECYLSSTGTISRLGFPRSPLKLRTRNYRRRQDQHRSLREAQPN